DEVLPGDSQFWITRPYSWRSLVGAKALFILAFISLPMLLGDGVIVRAYGFPLEGELSGLLWSQVLLAIVFVLPIAALSALTTGFVQLIFAILTPCVIALGVAIVAPELVLGGFLGGSDWVKTYYVFLLISVAASGILVWQYSMRRTAAARSLAVAAGILAVLGMALIPWSAAFKIQSWLSKQGVDQSLAHVRSEEHTSELQLLAYLVCRLLLEKKKKNIENKKDKDRFELTMSHVSSATRKCNSTIHVQKRAHDSK